MAAIDDLRSLILGGHYAPGDRLGEVELAETLNVSRTPVREALRRLEAEGLVEVTTNKGARVVGIPASTWRRSSSCAPGSKDWPPASAATTAAQDDVDRLHAVAVELREHAARGDIDAVYRLNSEFHQSLVRLGGSTLLVQSISMLIHSPVLLRTYGSFDEEAWRAASTTTSRSTAAIRAGDPDWAEAVMTAHLFSARASLLGPARRVTRRRSR